MVLLQAILNIASQIKIYKVLYLFWYIVWGGNFARRTRKLGIKDV